MNRRAPPAAFVRRPPQGMKAAVAAAAAQATAGPPTLEVDPAQALHLAIGLHREGRLDAAERIYRALAGSGGEGDANVLHFLGMLLHQRGRSDEALALMRRSIAADPTVADWHSNLGNVLLERARLDEAAVAYEEALRLAPERPAFHNNLGVLRREQGRFPEAQQAYRRAIELAPGHSDAYANCGNLLLAMGQPEQALAMFFEALVRAPHHAKTKRLLGMAYFNLGRLEEAVAVYRAWLAEEPGNAEAAHHLAACSGEQVPERAADGYVEQVFDGFAGSFDAKLAMLHYRAPSLVAGQLAACVGAPRAALDILDAGCGTGLCGPLLAPFARTLEGVDLSAGMLARAEPRQVYHRLVKAELTAFLQQSEAASRDVIVSADTLCYFGRLVPVFEAARVALRPGGWLIFTLEAVDPDLHGPLPGDPSDGFILNPHGRYSHDGAAVRADLEAAGLEPVAFDSVHLRNENARPVQGWLVAARRR